MIQLPNGIKLDPKGGWASSITEHAVSKKMPHLRGFLATLPDGTQQYVLAEYPKEGGEGQVICAHTCFEHMICHIDALWMANVLY